MAAAMANTGAVRRTDPQLVRFCNEDLLLPERLEADRVEAQMADGFLLGCVVAAIAPSVGLRLPEGFVEQLSRHDPTTVGRLQNFAGTSPPFSAANSMTKRCTVSYGAPMSDTGQLLP